MTGRDSLDDLFETARQNPIHPSDAFLARILADAEAEQPLRAARPVPTRRRAGPWSRLVASLGGAVAVAGLGSAAMAGLAIGYVQPAAVFGLADSYGMAALAGDSIDLLPGYASLLTEE